MSEKNLQPSELPDLISLTEVRRETGQPPGRIIRRCSKVWVDFVPVEEGYHWLGHRLMAHRRDRLVLIDGIYPLTEDSQRTIASRTMSPTQSMGFALVRDLAVETKTGILVVCSLSKGTCPPIPTPKIMVPREIFDELSTSGITTSSTDQGEKPEEEDTKIPFTPLEEVLLRMLKGGLNSEPAIKREINRELGRKMNRTYDFDHILVSWLNTERDSLIWKIGSKEEVYKWKTVINKISCLRKFLPKTGIS